MKTNHIYLTIILGLIAILATSCEDFLNQYPKGVYHHGNYNDTTNSAILAEAKLNEAYSNLRDYQYGWTGLAMGNYTTNDVNKGSTPSDGGDVVQFETLSYTAGNSCIGNYYSVCYTGITKANEALALAYALNDTVKNKQQMQAEALFVRALLYFRLTRAYGGVPYVNKVMAKDEETPQRSTQAQMWSYIEQDLVDAIPFLPTRTARLANGTSGRGTQNAARALLAKVYLYQERWADVIGMTTQIIASGDNALTTPYGEIFYEKNEFGPESVFEVFCEERPEEQIFLGSQYSQIQGIRGKPNLGWGFNSPEETLINAFEEGDPRLEATVIKNGDVLEGVTVKADPAGKPYFNKKAYVPKSERGVYGRDDEGQGQWMNIRVMRYAEVILMHAEAACEMGGDENMADARAKLEMVRKRARGGKDVLPEVTTNDQAELRKAIRHERRIELAMEGELFFDLVRWGVAKDEIDNFVEGKHELFPIPQTEIDKAGLEQNPNY